MNTTEEKKKG
nr:unnamed protein product [Callosobruchus analis]